MSNSTNSRPHGFIRMTNQRRVIIDVIKSTNEHPTAEWVFERVRERLPSISLATVYSNLRRLVELGEIQELHCGFNQGRFDGNPLDHAHFVCQKCNSVSDLILADYDNLNLEVQNMGYTILSRKLEFTGLCPSCISSLKQD